MRPTRAAEKRFFYGWWIVLASFVLQVYIGGAFFYSFTAFFEPIVNEFHWSYLAVSLAASLRSVEMGFASPIMGFMADRWGPRRLILSGVLITSVGFWMLSRTSSLATFYGSFIILAVGTSAFSSPVLMTAVANWFHQKVGRAMGLMSAGFGASGALVPVVVWLIDSYGWRTTMVVLGAGLLAIGTPASLVFRHRPEHYGLLPDGQAAPHPLEAGASPEARPAYEEAPAIGREFTTREALRTRAFWLITLAGAVQTLVVGAILVHVMPYLSSIGVARHQAALVAMLIPLTSIVGRLSMGPLGDIVDKRAILAVTMALQSAGILLFAHAQTPWLLIPFLAVYGPGYGGFIPLRATIQREYFGRRAFGTIQGLMMGLMTVGHIIGPSLAG
ncbi:MAG: MFS transporter, partial [Dehalococcoidia bacterium]